MKKWPSINVQPAPADQKERLLAWLREWELDRALSKADEPGNDSSVPPWPRSNAEASSGAQPPSAGQIRLLFPISSGTTRRPYYIAVLSKREPGQFLVAPFGRFALPATPGEWRSPRAEPPLRVLCLWNAAWLDFRVLSQSWWVDDLSCDEARQALAVWGAWRDSRGAGLEAEPHVGPPLRHPLDPRHDYLDEERAWMDELRDLSEGSRCRETPFPMPEQSLPLAAEEQEGYGGDRPPGDKGS